MRVAEKAIWGQTQVFQDAPRVLSAHPYTWGIRPRREHLLLSLSVLLILLEAVGKMEQYFLSLARTSLAYTHHTGKPGQRWCSVKAPAVPIKAKSTASFTSFANDLSIKAIFHPSLRRAAGGGSERHNPV